MKIAMLGHKHLPSRAGGVEVVVQTLSTEMAARGHEVTCYNRSGFGPRKRKYRGVRLVTVPALGKGGLGAVSASFFAAFLASFGSADVVHIHAEGPAFFSFLPKLTGKRVVVTIHGLDWQRQKWRGRFASRFIRWGEEHVVRFADVIIVLGQNQQRYFREQYGRETVLIPNGIQPPTWTDGEELYRLGLEKEEYVLFLGRLVPEKGIHTLLAAWKQVKTKKHLVIAGDSSGTDDYVRQLKTMAGERVLFPGFAEGRLLEDLYSHACVYVLPSTLEGMPVGLLEAMSYGNCCLVSDIPECRETAEDAAVYFPAGDADALAERLQELLEDPQKRQVYREKTGTVCRKYNWAEIVERTLRCYYEDPSDP